MSSKEDFKYETFTFVELVGASYEVCVACAQRSAVERDEGIGKPFIGPLTQAEKKNHNVMIFFSARETEPTTKP